MKNWIIILLFLPSLSIYSQENLIADRPDATEASVTLDKGVFQIEAGSLYDITDNTETWVINNSLFRYGVTDRFELRIVTQMSKVKDRQFEKSSLNIDDIELGTKIQLMEKSNFELAFLGHLIFPSGTKGSGVENVSWTSRLLIAHPVTDRFDFGYNLGFERYDSDEYGLTYTYSVATPLTDKIGFFIEVFGDWPQLEDEINATLDFGFTYMARPNMQFDFSTGTGLTERSNFYSMGISWRKPN